MFLAILFPVIVSSNLVMSNDNIQVCLLVNKVPANIWNEVLCNIFNEIIYRKIT